MPEMRATAGAVDFGAAREQAIVCFGADVTFDHGLKETWPAGAGIKFGVGSEQVEIAGDTPIQPRLMIVPIGSAERPFGASFARDPVLLGRELFLPFGLGFDDFLHGHIR